MEKNKGAHYYFYTTLLEVLASTVRQKEKQCIKRKK